MTSKQWIICFILLCLVTFTTTAQQNSVPVHEAVIEDIHFDENAFIMFDSFIYFSSQTQVYAGRKSKQRLSLKSLQVGDKIAFQQKRAKGKLVIDKIWLLRKKSR